jgi:hypothetical protein
LELKTKESILLDALRDARKEVSAQAIEDIEMRGRQTAANMLIQYGKAALGPDGFVYNIETAYVAALLWLLAEGYVTLTDKSQATDDEKAEREREKAEAKSNKSDVASEAEAYLRGGQYL